MGMVIIAHFIQEIVTLVAGTLLHIMIAIITPDITTTNIKLTASL